MACQANLIIARKDAELADMRRADWKVAHIKDLEGQLTERRDRIDDLDKELADKDARLAQLEAENRLLRARPMHKRPDFRDGIPSDEE